MDNTPTEDSPIPVTVKIAFYTGALLFLVAVVYTVVTTKEYPPEDMEAFEKEKAESGGVLGVFREILEGIKTMPPLMARLSIPQFFTWFALFCMWINFSPAVATSLFDPDTSTAEYRAGVEWAGVCFLIYNGVAFVFSFLLLLLVKHFSAKLIHTVSLILGGLGLLMVGMVPMAG